MQAGRDAPRTPRCNRNNGIAQSHAAPLRAACAYARREGNSASLAVAREQVKSMEAGQAFLSEPRLRQVDAAR